MAIQPNQAYNLTPDGTNYLTCPTTDGGGATLSELLLPYSTNAASQIWTTYTTGSNLNNIQLKCSPGDGNEYFLTGSGTDGRVLIVVTTEPTTTSWSIDANGKMTLNGDSVTGTQYANKTAATPPSPIESTEGVNWTFNPPIPALQTGTDYFLISDSNTYLVGNDTSGANAKLSGKLHGADSTWSITGTVVAGAGTINNAQIVSDDGSYIYGMHSDLTIQCFPVQNADYYWTIQDNGDGTAWFLCTHSVDNHNTGYLDANGTNPVVQVTKGTAGQKWKFKKTLTSTGDVLPG
ncbi:MAG: hypothetical protein Q8M15_07260 [Bacteroidota bacterium]|nr:hypothetical protein [Bacteroidota bacterium]